MGSSWGSVLAGVGKPGWLVYVHLECSVSQFPASFRPGPGAPGFPGAAAAPACGSWWWERLQVDLLSKGRSAFPAGVPRLWGLADQHWIPPPAWTGGLGAPSALMSLSCGFWSAGDGVRWEGADTGKVLAQ